ncbi:MAG: hypothetical protein M1833_002168 [Piccolia ochrophora]|nr:MAG: hypothetical protein M1833_002168 [Piccolia ochrophora]
MPPKRPPTGAPTANTPSRSKQPKTENFGPEEFSNSVKKRLASSSRTGQACDRCKVRKIRCDGLPGGCSPCIQNNTECRTTDRITGRATSRGYVEGLEHRTHDMGNRIRDLEAQLMSHGVDVKPMTFHDIGPSPHAPSALEWHTNGANGTPPMWGRSGGALNGLGMPFQSGPDPDAEALLRPQETNMFRALPVFRTGCSGANYLGVSSGNSYLSSIKGTALSVLGMEIDIADFNSSDMDEPTPSLYQPGLYNKSYQSFLQSALNVNPKIEKADLPPRNEGLTYATWYFRVLNPYCPVLHKPTLLTLLTRMYDDLEFRPTPAEIVMVHMMFAIMFFQYATRNVDNEGQQSELNTRSNLHYHYSLGFYYQISASHTLQDVQALTLICLHLRNFPKPGASWMVTTTAMTLAVELGLHRSAARWVQTNSQKNILEIEMRKRVFYTILSIHVTLSGKLGRPMPLRLDDFDVELPEPIDDDFLSEAGIDTSRSGKCSHLIGIEAYKATLLFLEMFSSLYAVKRSPSAYIETVRHLEAKLEKWREQWPAELNPDSASVDQEERVFSVFLETWVMEFRLLVRHPSISMTSSVEFNNESLQICVDSARSMLSASKLVSKFKSLDTTWYQGAVYLMAITTTLFAQWERRDDITATDLSNLREDMDDWLEIMGEVGILLGSGNRLREAVRVVMDGTIGILDRTLADASATSQGQNGEQRSKSHSPGQTAAASNEENEFTNTTLNEAFPNTNGANGRINSTDRANGYLPADETGLANSSNAYPSTDQYSYPEPSTGSNITYPSTGSVFADGAYTSSDEAMAANALNAANASATSQTADPSLNLFTTTTQPYQTSTAAWFPGSHSWRQWTGTMAGSLEPQDCYSASALMQLGGQRGGLGNAEGDVAGSAPVPEMSSAAAAAAAVAAAANVPGDVQSQAPWPLMIFDIGQGQGPAPGSG